MTKSKIRSVIVDDEKHSIGVMQIQLETHCPEIEVVATFSDSIEAYAYLKDSDIDLLFVDIEMPRLNGFELLSKLGSYTFKSVITSAYDQFGIKAVKNRIFDYLVKPVDPDELKGMIQRFLDEPEQASTDLARVEDRILLSHSSEVEFVSIADIMRCESDKNYTTVYLHDGSSIVISKTMKTIEELLPPTDFVRVHSKHLIGIRGIKSYIKSDGGSFKLQDGTNVPLSRYRKDEVLKMLGMK